MRRFTAFLLAVVLGVAAAVALVSCGGGGNADLLPGNTANEITANLDKVKQLASGGDCAGAQSEALQVSEQIDALGGVDKRLKQALRDGAIRLNEVVASCTATTAGTAPITVPSTSESTPTPAKQKGPKKPKTATTPTVTTPTTTTTAPTLPPQANGNGNGLGNGNGNGPGTSEGGGTGAPSGGVAPGSPASGGD
jgi:hypothetical protein